MNKNNIFLCCASLVVIGGIGILLPFQTALGDNNDNVAKQAEKKVKYVVSQDLKEVKQSKHTNVDEDSNDLILVNKTHKAPDNLSVDLVNITPNEQVAKRVKKHYEELAKAAEQAGYPLVVVSAYRSKQYQETVYNRQVNSYLNQGLSKEESEKKTNEYIMQPGTSEHQTGLAIDVLDKKEYQIRPELSPEFGNTDAGKWLQDNSYKYGFIIRYPKDKENITKIKYEPWHLRYVGVKNAEKMTKQGVCLEEYVKETN